MYLFLFGVLLMTYMTVVSKRITALVNAFSLQSFFIFLIMLYNAVANNSIELYIVSFLLLILKVILIPRFLHRIVKSINVNERLGLYINPLLSLFFTIILTYLSYLFAEKILNIYLVTHIISFVVAMTVTMTGLFIMIVRMKAISQIIGLLSMENGIFLTAVTMCGSMPFFVEIAIFFDVFVCVIILGIFVFRIKEHFTHIDIDKLSVLKG